MTKRQIIPHTLPDDIGQRIQRAREWIDFSRDQLAEAADCSPDTIKNIEIRRSQEPARVRKVVRTLNKFLAERDEPPVLLNSYAEATDWVHLPDRPWSWQELGPGALLDPIYRIVPFHGPSRLAELGSLLDWCRQDNHHLVRAYRAAAGMGKTRLALELCRTLRDEGGWQTGFLTLSLLPKGNPWSLLKRTHESILVVVDYAGSVKKTSALQRLIKGLASAPFERVRLLMLDRDSLWIGRLQGNTKIFDILSGGALAESRLENLLPPVAPDLKSRIGSFDAAVKAFVQPVLNKPPTTPLPKAPNNLSSSIYNKVLIIQMQALESLLGGSTSKRMASVVTRILVRERGFWERSLAARKLPERWMPAVEKAVLAIGEVGGVSHLAEAAQLLKKVPYLKTLSELDLDQFVLMLRECYPDEGKGIAPLQPDLLRERLADENLGR